MEASEVVHYRQVTPKKHSESSKSEKGTGMSPPSINSRKINPCMRKGIEVTSSHKESRVIEQTSAQEGNINEFGAFYYIAYLCYQKSPAKGLHVLS